MNYSVYQKIITHLPSHLGLRTLQLFIDVHTTIQYVRTYVRMYVSQ